MLKCVHNRIYRTHFMQWDVTNHESCKYNLKKLNAFISQNKTANPLFIDFDTRITVTNVACPVLEFNMNEQFEDLPTLFSVCQTLYSWLGEDTSNIIILHCPVCIVCGCRVDFVKDRPMYFTLVVACFLVYSGEYRKAIEAYSAVQNTCVYNAEFMPSIIRYLKFFTFLRQAPKLPPVKRKKLNSITMNSLPFIQPYFMITQRGNVMFSSQTTNCKFSVTPQGACEFDIQNCVLLGDFVLNCFSTKHDILKKEFRYTFNTAMMNDRVVEIKKAQLDIVCTNRSVSDDFVVKLYFEDLEPLNENDSAVRYEDMLDKMVDACPTREETEEYLTKYYVKQRSGSSLMKELKSRLSSIFRSDTKKSPRQDRKSPRESQRINESSYPTQQIPKREPKPVQKIEEKKDEDKKVEDVKPEEQVEEKKPIQQVPPLKIQESETQLPPTPPPPPPPLPNFSVIPPPPPPPPSGKKSKNTSNGVQLRQLHWKPIPEYKVKDTMWSQVNTEALKDLVDEKKLAELFTPRTRSLLKRTSRDQMKRKHEQPKKKSLINFNRARNIEIMLSQFKTISDPAKHFGEIIESLDQTKISRAHVHTLLKCAPTEEEEELLQQYKGDISELSKVDILLLSLMKISRLKEKLLTLDYMLQFDDHISEIDDMFRLKMEAYNQLMKSKKLTRVLELILAIGNTLNRGSKKGGNAKGFKLDSLSSLSTTKASDGKTTLMHFLASVAIKEMDSISFSAEVSRVGPSAKIPLTFLYEHVEAIRVQIEHFEREIEFYKFSNNQQALTKLLEFVNKAKQKYDTTAQNMLKAEQTLQSLFKYFGEDAQDAMKREEELFQNVSSFINEFTKCLYEEKTKRKGLSKAKSLPNLLRF